MAYEFRLLRRVEFADTDTAGVVHFSAFFRYMEEAEHAFYRSLGGSAYVWTPDRVEGMPRVSAHCEYRQPLHYAEEVEVHLTVLDKTSRSLRYEATFSRLDGSTAVEVARGGMTVVFASRTHGARDWAGTTLPAELAGQIEVAPAARES